MIRNGHCAVDPQAEDSMSNIAEEPAESRTMVGRRRAKADLTARGETRQQAGLERLDRFNVGTYSGLTQRRDALARGPR